VPRWRVTFGSRLNLAPFVWVVRAPTALDAALVELDRDYRLWHPDFDWPFYIRAEPEPGEEG